MIDGAETDRTEADRTEADRIHECLDGRLPRSALTDPELLELEELERLVHESLAVVRRAPAPDMVQKVMERVRGIEVEAPSVLGVARPRSSPFPRSTHLAGVLRWLWTPRAIRLRPAWLLVGATVAVLGTGLLPLRRGEPIGTASQLGSGAPAATPEAILYIRFELDVTGVSSVRLAGTFTGWQARYELAETTPGRWTALVPLRPGVHDYAFVLDGERWVTDPRALLIADGFGGVNSRIALLGPEEARDPGAS